MLINESKVKFNREEVDHIFDTYYNWEHYGNLEGISDVCANRDLVHMAADEKNMWTRVKNILEEIEDLEDREHNVQYAYTYEIEERLDDDLKVALYNVKRALEAKIWQLIGLEYYKGIINLNMSNVNKSAREQISWYDEIITAYLEGKEVE